MAGRAYVAPSDSGTTVSDGHGGAPGGSQMISVGHYQPARIVANDELAAIVDTSDDGSEVAPAS